MIVHIPPSSGRSRPLDDLENDPIIPAVVFNGAGDDIFVTRADWGNLILTGHSLVMFVNVGHLVGQTCSFPGTRCLHFPARRHEHDAPGGGGGGVSYMGVRSNQSDPVYQGMDPVI